MFPNRRVLLQMLGFSTGTSLIAYFAGELAALHAIAIFTIFWAGIYGSWIASKTYPAAGGYRRSLPDTLKYVFAVSLFFGLMAYLMLYLLGAVETVKPAGGMMTLVALMGSWFACAMVLEWFGREPKA